MIMNITTTMIANTADPTAIPMIAPTDNPLLSGKGYGFFSEQVFVPVDMH